MAGGCSCASGVFGFVRVRVAKPDRYTWKASRVCARDGRDCLYHLACCRRAERLGALCLLPIFLGFGYIAAWELVGAMLFKGLLWDVYAYSPSLNEVWLHLEIACLLAGIYGITTAAIFVVHKTLEKRRD